MNNIQTTKLLIKLALETIDNMYNSLSDLKDILNELVEESDLDDDMQYALLECHQALNDPELLDEIAARLGCILYNEEE